MIYSAAHSIDELLVNKILTYRPSHPIKVLIDGLYDEIKKSELYKNNIGRFEKDREITLSSGDFEGWLWKSVISKCGRWSNSYVVISLQTGFFISCEKSCTRPSHRRRPRWEATYTGANGPGIFRKLLRDVFCDDYCTEGHEHIEVDDGFESDTTYTNLPSLVGDFTDQL